MSKVIIVTLLASYLAGSASAAEGFGSKKVVVSMQRTVPPALNVPAGVVDVSVSAAPAKAKEAERDLILRTLASKVITSVPRFSTSGRPDVHLAIAVEQFAIEEDKRVNTWRRGEFSGNSYTPPRNYSALPPTSDIPTVRKKGGRIQLLGVISGTYRISDARGNLLGTGRFEEKAAQQTRKKEDGELIDHLLQRTAWSLGSCLVETKQSTPVVLPQGSFASLIPLAQSQAWDRYLAAVETMAPLASPADEAYRQYALGLAKEAVAYNSDRARGLQLLRESVTHYLNAIGASPDEPVFREAVLAADVAVEAPLKRATASAKAYAAWHP